MELYVDTANTQEIQSLTRYGFIDGITTNPSLIAKEKSEFRHVIQTIASMIKGSVWCQVTKATSDEMYEQAIEMATWTDKIIIKLPMTKEGLAAAYRLKQNGIQVNMTLIYSLSQVVLAAKAGVDYISPYVGRMDDITSSGIEFIQRSKELIRSMKAPTKIIGASIRSPQIATHLINSEIDAITLPYPIFLKMFEAPMTNIGLHQFDEDWSQYEKDINSR